LLFLPSEEFFLDPLGAGRSVGSLKEGVLLAHGTLWKPLFLDQQQAQHLGVFRASVVVKQIEPREHFQDQYWTVAL
tara:strand:+ start:7983 stop:8210 length:228 start_codon:yes stop_codon:yes gene_type:complete